jgi:hypothetical protein
MKLFLNNFGMFLILIFVNRFAFSQDLHPLYPKGQRMSSANIGILSDELCTFQHCDDEPEYYLGSGNSIDTFFVVFEPPCACSIKYVEAQWYDDGDVTAFAAWYSDSAQMFWPSGQAPPRLSTSISPIGEWITPAVPNTIAGSSWSGLWEELSLGGAEFICGDTATLEPGIFGIGFVKSGATPHPLADRVDTKGIFCTYTWFYYITAAT